MDVQRADLGQSGSAANFCVAANLLARQSIPVFGRAWRLSRGNFSAAMPSSNRRDRDRC